MPALNIDTLNKERLKKAAGAVIYARGQAYFDWGRVNIITVTDQYALCSVQGTRLYHVEIEVDEKYLYLKCDCPYAAKNEVCKHDVAAALAVRQHLLETQPLTWTHLLNRVLQTPKAAPQRQAGHKYLLFFSLQKTENSPLHPWELKPVRLSFSILPEEVREAPEEQRRERLHLLFESNPTLAQQAKVPLSVLKPRACMNCRTESVLLANLMIERARAANFPSKVSHLEEYLSQFSSHAPLFLGTKENPLQEKITIVPTPGEIRVHISEKGRGLKLEAIIHSGKQRIPIKVLKEHKRVEIVNNHPLRLLAGNQLIKLNNRKDFLSVWLASPEVTIPAEDRQRFVDRFFLTLAKKVPLEGDLVSREKIDVDPVPRLYLSDEKGKLQAKLRFSYAGTEVPYKAKPARRELRQKTGEMTVISLIRKPEQEEQIYKSLSSTRYRLKRAPSKYAPGTFVLRARAHPIDFLMYSVPRLTETGFEVYGEEELKTAHVNRSKPTISINVSSGIDWFDVQTVVSFGEIEVSLKEIRKAMKKKGRYVKLADGSIGEIPEEWIERYKHLFEMGKEAGGTLRLGSQHLTLIDQLLEQADQAQADSEFERRRKKLLDFSGIAAVKLPEGFEGELRPYQKAGYDWLHFLHEYGFGGCLADDMGLGKTIQALVFLQSLKEGLPDGNPNPAREEQVHRASLIVLPRSLLVNWQREAARFTPQLSILEYFDTNRPNDSALFDEFDLVLTTYGVMRRDIKLLRKYAFEYALLDESQAIKNPNSQTSKAARLLKARHRLVLTGTPVENTTIELWSQFAFLNPGLLGSLEYFKREFTTPIESKGDEKAARFLRRMVYPFILRRTKKQVAPELPPRTERIRYTDMQPAQRKFYLRTRDYYRGLLMGLIEEQGLNHVRMKVLEGLLRLRQISNHPRLVDEQFRGASGKFDLLLETLETLQSEGHKALVFSQFVQMLKLVRTALDERQVPYVYLDGSTHNRQEPIDAFQSDEGIPFFLISLKAGGVGLNLTAADYVIHIDPWWNPAVEMQASDRTHRIGQDKPVFVFKLITRDSVEEKILQLQERKKELVDQLISTESSFFKSLTTEDINSLFS
jgi:non-specific serine/threonine protein kinase